MPPNPRGGRFFPLETEPNIRIMYVCIYYRPPPTFTPTNRPDSPVVDQIAPTTERPLSTETGKTAPLLTNSQQNQRPSMFISGSLTPHSPRDIGKTAPLLTNSTDRPFHRPGAPSPLVSLFLKKTHKKPNTPQQPRRNPLIPNRTGPTKTPTAAPAKNFFLTPMR